MNFSILTLGCKVNQVESDQAREVLTAAGFRYVAAPADAQLLILNTCSVTHVADRKSRQLFSRARQGQTPAGA